MNYICHYLSPLGGITLSSDGEALTGLWFDGQKYFGSTIEGEVFEKNLSVFEMAERWLNTYFKGTEPDFTPPLRLNATPFRKLIWETLLTVSYGKTVSYGELAKTAALKSGQARISARAVGGAVGHNPISLIVPCHRVLGADGSLTGYAGGVDRKRKLLLLENKEF